MNLDSDKSSIISFSLWNTKSFEQKCTSPILYLISFSSKTGKKYTSLVFSIPPTLRRPRKSGLISSGKLASSPLYGIVPKPEINVTTPLMPWQFWFWFSVSGVGFSSVQFSHSVVSDSLWPHNCSMPGLPVHHQLPELTQTHVYWVGDAIQPSHLLLSPSPPTFNLSEYQGLFKWVSSSHQEAKVLEFHLPMNIQDWFLLGWTGLISLQPKGLSRVFSNTTVQKHQFFGTQPSL